MFYTFRAELRLFNRVEAAVLTTLFLSVVASLDAGVRWQSVVPGVEYSTVRVEPSPRFGDGLLHLVRIDSKVAPVIAAAVSEEGGEPLTAAAWSRKHRLAVVFNAGMYEPDHSTHTGAFSVGAHQNNAEWVEKYKSVLVGRGAGGTELIDTDGRAIKAAKATVVAQNLRLIRRPGVNVWAQTARAWSEAALAVLADGRLLMVFSRTPFTMHNFNEHLLQLGLSVVEAMHLEGGPEASLSIHAGGINLDLCGSFETGFVGDDSNHHQWPLPNIFGVRQ